MKMVKLLMLVLLAYCLFSYFSLWGKTILKYLAILALIGVFFVGLFHSTALAFDTGHHSDVTRSALKEEGFLDTSIKITQLQNWLVDYYSNTPTAKNLDVDMEKLHFDNLYSTRQIRNYWGHLTLNSKAAIQTAARDKDPLKALTILGVSLHALQDFYTHSNWVKLHPRGSNGFRTDTWFDKTPSDDANLFTGYYPTSPKPPTAFDPHGEYTSGLNKDSYVRPNFDEAYVFAYVASRQWAAMMRGWASEIDPAFWSRVQTFRVNEKDNAHLVRDLNAAYRISEWIAAKGNNGHWKGSGSGTDAELVPFSAIWTTETDSVFVDNIKERRTHAPLITGLLSNALLRDGKQIPAPVAGNIPAIPRAQFNKKVIIVRTLQVNELSVGIIEPKIDVGGKADFFAKILVGDQTFVESMQLDRDSVETNWTTIYFVPSGSVSIRYELWDEDTGVLAPDDLCDINPVASKSHLEFLYNTETRISSGDVTGLHDSNANAFISGGATPDKDRASVKFYVKTDSLITSP